jgi:hypothetical protein
LHLVVYLTPIKNLGSICEHGVLSHELAAKLPHGRLV